MSKGNVLITGGAGFIGSHLVDQLISRGHKVTVLDCLLPQVHGDADLDADGWPIYLHPQAKRIKGDILDANLFHASLEGITHVVHLAASIGVGQSMTNILDYTRNNTMAAASMLEVLLKRSHTVKRIAVASSMSIYGEGEYFSPSQKIFLAPPLRTHEQLQCKQWELKLDEASQNSETLEPVPTRENKPLQPASIYAINKRDHEEMFLVVGRALGIPTIGLRLFNTYGSRQALSNPYTGVAAIFISRLLNNEAPLIFEDGKQKRDFVHVMDVAEAFTTAIESENRVWDVYNVGSGKSISITEIATILARLLKKNIAPQILNRHRVGDIRHCFADISKIQHDFNFYPKRDFEVGMNELIQWVKTTSKSVDKVAEGLASLEQNKLLV